MAGKNRIFSGWFGVHVRSHLYFNLVLVHPTLHDKTTQPPVIIWWRNYFFSVPFSTQLLTNRSLAANSFVFINRTSSSDWNCFCVVSCSGLEYSFANGSRA
jgi:hypothetical protein